MEGITTGWERSELIKLFRYLHLGEAYDANFWQTLLKRMEHPTEAGGIASSFRVTDLFW